MTTPYPENPENYDPPTATRPLETPDLAPTVTAEAEPAAPAAGLAPSPVDDPKRPVRMRTVVLGLILLVIAGAVLVSELTDLSVDPGAVILALMIGAGVLLIAGARRS